MSVGILFTPYAHAHSFYTKFCCNDKDCRPLRFDEVRQTPDGWLLLEKYLVPYKSSKILEIPPEASAEDASKFHACILYGQVRCLYVPQGGV